MVRLILGLLILSASIFSGCIKGDALEQDVPTNSAYNWGNSKPDPCPRGMERVNGVCLPRPEFYFVGSRETGCMLDKRDTATYQYYLCTSDEKTPWYDTIVLRIPTLKASQAEPDPFRYLFPNIIYELKNQTCGGYGYGGKRLESGILTLIFNGYPAFVHFYNPLKNPAGNEWMYRIQGYRESDKMLYVIGRLHERIQLGNGASDDVFVRDFKYKVTKLF